MDNLQDVDIFDQCRDEVAFHTCLGLIIESAIDYTAHIKFGPKQRDGEIFLNWPEVIVKTLGLRQVESKAVNVSWGLYKVLFEPEENFEFQSYWSRLFGNVRPRLEINLDCVEDAGRDCVSVTHCNLIWPSDVGLDERADALLEAFESQEKLNVEVQFFEKAFDSLNEEAPFGLVKSILAHLSEGR